jgi:hypothetical protein
MSARKRAPVASPQPLRLDGGRPSAVHVAAGGGGGAAGGAVRGGGDGGSGSGGGVAHRHLSGVHRPTPMLPASAAETIEEDIAGEVCARA